MDGTRMRLLINALTSAYPSNQKLAVFVRIDLDRNLADITGDGPLHHTAFQLVEQAVAEGWDDLLTRRLIDCRPANRQVAAYAEAYGLGLAAARAVPAKVRHQNDAYFDLDHAKNVIHDLLDDQQAGLLGMWVTAEETAAAKRLCAWLPHCLGDLEEKDDVSLGAVIADPDHKVKQILQHLPELDETSIVCQVLVNDATPAAVDGFWQGVRDGCGPIEGWFVLLFVTATDAPPPCGVHDLGRPVFTRLDVAKWARDVLAGLGWPADLARPWSGYVQKRAELRDGFSIPLTYGALRSSITAARRCEDPAQFSAWLQGELVKEA
ncbi:effector-associated domain EAD1-containing protein [Dactylosporangium salmoneum]|uniref:Effector-associated domain-containing protein n=1 Tax=Dactylosporangium salmoneum TaxID=53361 RepID=A0ABP5TG92_9ACTN